MIFLGRSTILVAPSLQGSKYTLLVVVQVLLLVVVVMTGREPVAPVGACVSTGDVGNATPRAAGNAAAESRR